MSIVARAPFSPIRSGTLAPVDELAGHLHAASPAGMSERDLFALGIAVDPGTGVEEAAHGLEVAALDRAHEHLVERCGRDGARKVRRSEMSASLAGVSAVVARFGIRS